MCPTSKWKNRGVQIWTGRNRLSSLKRSIVRSRFAYSLVRAGSVPAVAAGGISSSTTYRVVGWPAVIAGIQKRTRAVFVGSAIQSGISREIASSIEVSDV